MARTAHPLRAGGPAAASLLVNGLIVAALLGLQVRPDNRSVVPPTRMVTTFAVPQGNDTGVEDAQVSVDPPSSKASPVQPHPSPPLPSPQRPSVEPAAVPLALTPAAAALPPSVALSAPLGGTTTSQPASQPGSAASGSTASLQARKGAADGVDVKAPAGTSRSYAARVRSWLYAHKVYPRHARMRRQEGLVQVRFVLGRDGVLLDGAITRKSGVASLDDEAQAMLQRSSPYPRPPADLPGERIEFTAPIEFTLPS